MVGYIALGLRETMRSLQNSMMDGSTQEFTKFGPMDEGCALEHVVMLSMTFDRKQTKAFQMFSQSTVDTRGNQGPPGLRSTIIPHECSKSNT